MHARLRILVRAALWFPLCLAAIPPGEVPPDPTPELPAAATLTTAPLDAEAALRLALANDGLTQAGNARAESTAARARADNSWANPELRFEHQAPSDPGDPDRHTLALRIEPPSPWGLRAARRQTQALTEEARAEADMDMREWRTVFLETFFEIVHLRRRLAIESEWATMEAAAAGNAGKAAAAGAADALQALEDQAESLETRTRLAEDQTQLSALESRLGTWLRADPLPALDETIPAVDPAALEWTADQLAQAAFDRDPELERRAAGVRAAESARDLTRAGMMPWPSYIQAGHRSADDDGAGERWEFSIGLELPVFSRAELTAARAELNEARQELAAEQDRLRADITRALGALQASTRAWLAIAPEHQALEAGAARMLAAGADILPQADRLPLLRRLYRARRALLDLSARHQEARLELEALVGTWPASP